MPTFALTTHAPAPVEEVWKLLHDPARFPEWWDGVETVANGTDGDYTIWPAGYPDFPMAQRPSGALQLALRSTTPPQALAGVVRRELASIDRQV